MKVLVSKDEIHAIGQKYPLFKDCPAFVEVTAKLKSKKRKAVPLSKAQKARMLADILGK